MRIFFDSSAFAKRYVYERGTDAVLACCDRASEIVMSIVALPEVVSALCSLNREKKITEQQYRQLKDAFLADIEDAAICDLTPSVLANSIEALESSLLRSMDAIHVGSALSFECDLFVSADQRQCEAARRAGLRVERV